jgi:hypothetical protein
MSHDMLSARLLSSPTAFKDDWLRQGAKRQAPVPAGPGTEEALARRVAAGARTGGADIVLVAAPVPTAGNSQAPSLRSDAHGLLAAVQSGSPVLLCLPNLSGAVLTVPTDGYALIAGQDDFLSGALPEGVDTACARFSSYARRNASDRPALAAVSARFSTFQRSWRSAGDPPVDSHVGRQLALMRAFAARTVSAEDFARGWLEERRRSLDVHERVHGALSNAVEVVFRTLEDFSIDPSLRDDDDVTPDQLRAVVHEVLTELGG